jgi:hypothetical protein
MPNDVPDRSTGISNERWSVESAVDSICSHFLLLLLLLLFSPVLNSGWLSIAEDDRDT